LYQDTTAKGRQSISLLSSVVAHAVVIALCYFFVRWSPPDPPLPEYGVQMNFGIDPEGFGDLQSLAPANTSDVTDAAPSTAEAIQENQPKQEAPQEATAPEEITSASTQEAESPVEVPPTPPKKQPEPAKPDPKPVVKTETKTSTNPAPPSYKPATQQPGTGGVAGTGTAQAGNNNGDRPGKVGDQGVKEGSLDAKGLYGKQGNGNGSNLDLAGWNWDSKPDKIDKFDEDGKIVFEIKVDDEGNLVNVRTIEKTVSPKVVQFYQDQVEKLTFSKTKDNGSPAPFSTGKITIIIRSR
jgi:outer membrane biosynthesis protein TonB